MDLTFFPTPADFRKWFERYHETEKELWVGFYKKATKIPSITWSESVDEALCFGWIDGLRKRIDEKSYKIRFTPRNPKSHWSAVNIKKIATLKEKGLMKKAGLEAFAKMDPKNSELATYERKPVPLASEFEAQFKANKTAWASFQAMAPGYRKMAVQWIMTAKQETTRQRRLGVLIQSSEEGLKIPSMRRR